MRLEHAMTSLWLTLPTQFSKLDHGRHSFPFVYVKIHWHQYLLEAQCLGGPVLIYIVRSKCLFTSMWSSSSLLVDFVFLSSSFGKFSRIKHNRGQKSTGTWVIEATEFRSDLRGNWQPQRPFLEKPPQWWYSRARLLIAVFAQKNCAFKRVVWLSKHGLSMMGRW